MTSSRRSAGLMSLLTFALPLGARNPVCWRQRAFLQLANSFHTGYVCQVGLKRQPVPKVAEQWQTPGLELPPGDEWWKLFRFSEKRKRRTVSNPATAKMLAELYVPKGSKDKVVIEAWAGPGMLTRALLDLPKSRIRKIIVLEEEPLYANWLKPLTAIDDRIHVIQADAYEWATYTDLEASGLLSDVGVHSWDAGIHPDLQFIAQIPNHVLGEQLIAQLCRAVPDRQWLYKYGRVPLGLLTSSTMVQRMISMDKRTRCKVGVMTQALTEVSVPLPAESFSPVLDHFFWPTRGTHGTQKGRFENEAPQQPILVLPKEQPAIAPGCLEPWDFVLRNLFITKATPLKKAISGLGPGSQALLKKLDDPTAPESERVNPDLAIRELSLNDWSNIVRVFEEWPFRPENLSINHSFTRDRRKE